MFFVATFAGQVIAGCRQRKSSVHAGAGFIPGRKITLDTCAEVVVLTSAPIPQNTRRRARAADICRRETESLMEPPQDGFGIMGHNRFVQQAQA